MSADVNSYFINALKNLSRVVAIAPSVVDTNEIGC